MRFRIAVILCLFVLSSALPAFAQTINGCVDTKQGTLRIVKPSEPCDTKEYAVSWNTPGVPGKDGKDGTNGVNGINGTNGTNGTNGLDGRDGINCEPPAPEPPAQIGDVIIAGIAGGPYLGGVYQFSGGVTNAASIGGGGGGGTGKADFSDVAIVRKVDAASPLLFEFLASGQHIQDVRIDLVPGTAGPRYVRLFDVMITSYGFIRLTGSNDLFETVSFAYGKIQFHFDGSDGCFDLIRWTRC